jgi:hypothetical protein
MNFVKLSTSYEHLYSPKSWLHFQDKRLKMTAVLIQLICLPVISLKHILIVFLAALLLCRSINIPKSLRKYFRKNIMIFTFFLLISIKKYSVSSINKADNRHILQVYPLNCLNEQSVNAVRQPGNSFFYLHASVLRLIAIHSIYLILVRCLLLTTSYEDIVKIALMGLIYSQDYSNVKFIFIIMASSQFLKIIFEQMENMRVSCILRNINISQVNLLKITFVIFTSLLRQLAIKTRISIFTIASSLYNRDIESSSLNVYN